MSSADPPDKDSDLDAFARAMEGVERVDSERTEPFHRRRRPEPLNLPDGDEQQELADSLAVETGEFLDYRQPGIQHRVYQDLRRGVISPEATLDLHGLRVHEARTVLPRFLDQAMLRGYRCVRVIHGKGRDSGQQPVLKQKTDQWLRQRPEVLAFCTAPRWDGGTGAAYVLLSRKSLRR